MTLPVAPPGLYAEAWEVGVMGGSALRSMREITLHPPTIPDPTYHRDDHGWHDAAGISNPIAQRSLAAYLERKGYRVSDEVQAAWDEHNRRGDIRARIERITREVCTLVEDDIESRPTFSDYARLLIADLENAVEDEDE